MESKPLMKMIKVNRDLFLRTVCLLIMTIVFTSKGASLGELTLAANAIILQVHYIMAYLFGGFANASSILVGRAVGGQKKLLYHRAYLLSVQWGLCTAILLSIMVLFFGEMIISMFTTIPEVRVMANTYITWIALFPILGFWGLQLEGIFSGATDARSIRDSILLALFVFLVSIWMLVPAYENHGVWLAFIIFSLSRSVFLSIYIQRLTSSIFHSN